MSAPPARGPYAKSAQVRRRILEVCVEVFGETGFYGASTKDIAQRAGISHTGLRHHFPRKEDLLAAVMELRDDQSVQLLESAQALDPQGHPVEALLGMLAVVAELERQPGILALYCVTSGEATAPDHPAHPYYVERYRGLRAFYTAAYTALAQRGALRSVIAPETLATMTLGLLGGLQEQWLFDRDAVGIEHMLRTFIGSFVPDLAPPNPPSTSR
ncbi:TetR/AcrR family transcriptional regulator [Streptomyces sp. NPDC050263]|uniref:TetR/AcrR family transcriptional regulator n=1 Tax=Streptomyces sp. NPDC050263 TaxID=3155037 RepID=UPI0034480BAE